MLKNEKTILAKLLSNENINVMHNNVETASFDLESRTLTLPIFKEELSNTLYDLFIGHEVSHARNTPPQGWHDSIIDLKIPRYIVNILEDVRIEKLIKQKYPGLKNSFFQGYKELFDKGFFGSTNLESFMFLDKINIYFKVSAYAKDISFTQSERMIIEKIDKMKSFEDVVDMAKYLHELQKKYDENKKNKKDFVLPDDSDLEESDENNSFDFEGSSFAGTQLDDSDELKGNEKSKEKKDTLQIREKDIVNQEKLEEKLQTEGLDLGKNKTEKELEKFKSMMTKRETSTYCITPTFILDKLIVDYKTVAKELGRIVSDPKIYRKFVKENGKTVSYLVKEFELRKNAKQIQKAQIKNTGDLDMNRIFSYKFTEDIFRKNTVVDNGKSHGMIMYLDWSGSMENYIHKTFKQVLELALFCRNVNIPFEVYAFTDCYKTIVDRDVDVFENDRILIDNFKLLNLLSSRMSGREFNRMSELLLDVTRNTNRRMPHNYHLGGTPLHQAILSSIQIIDEFKKRTRVDKVNLIFLTDGDGEILSSKYEIDKSGYLKNNSYFKRYNKNYKVSNISSADNNYIHYSENKNIFVNFERDKRNQDQVLYDLVRKVTGVNIMGFYLTRYYDFYHAVKKIKLNPEEIKKGSEFFEKEHYYLAGKVLGYDEYFILKTDIPNPEDISKMKESDLESILEKFYEIMKDKIKSKVILNRFIELII